MTPSSTSGLRPGPLSKKLYGRTTTATSFKLSPRDLSPGIVAQVTRVAECVTIHGTPRL
jgi:hypothetical protein